MMRRAGVARGDLKPSLLRQEAEVEVPRRESDPRGHLRGVRDALWHGTRRRSQARGGMGGADGVAGRGLRAEDKIVDIAQNRRDAVAAGWFWGIELPASAWPNGLPKKSSHPTYPLKARGRWPVPLASFPDSNVSGA